MTELTTDQPEKQVGQLDILNCGEGHLEIKFDKGDPVETAKAEHVIKDMLRRGYALFIEGPDKTLIRVQEFDEKNSAYIIAAEATEPAEVGESTGQPIPPGLRGTRGPGKGRRRTQSVSIHGAKTVAIGRTAGG